MTAKGLLRKIEEERAVVKNLNNNEILLGILLGYGQHNAELFDQRLKLSKFLDQSHPIIKGSSAERNEKKIAKKLSPLSGYTYFPLWKVHPVQCAADVSRPESRRLKEKYTVLRQKINALYERNENLLELVLERLCHSEDEN